MATRKFEPQFRQSMWAPPPDAGIWATRGVDVSRTIRGGPAGGAKPTSDLSNRMVHPIRKPRPASGEPTCAQRFPPSGFSLVELLVVIAVLAVLISILVPTVRFAMDEARLVGCQSNLRRIGELCKLWAADRDSGKWFDANASRWRGWGIDSTYGNRRVPMGLANLVVDGYLSHADTRVFYCPAWKHPYGQFDETDEKGEDLVGRPHQYGGWPRDWNSGMPTRHIIISYHYRASFGERRNEPPSSYLTYPSGTAIVADHFTRREVLYGAEYGHGEKYNALYMDGHVETTRDRVGYMNQVNTHYSHGNWSLQEDIWRAFFDRTPPPQNF